MGDLLVVKVEGLYLLGETGDLELEVGLACLFVVDLPGGPVELVLELVDLGPPPGHLLTGLGLSVNNSK